MLAVNPNARIIGIAGRIGSGKTTLANFLVEKHGYHKLSFAAHLRTELAHAGFPGDLLDTKPLPQEIRALMQAYGCAKRYLDVDYWVKKADLSLRLAMDAGRDKFVFDDLRYPNELEWLKKRGGMSVLISLRASRYDCLPLPEHESEKAFDNSKPFDKGYMFDRGDLAGIERAADDLAANSDGYTNPPPRRREVVVTAPYEDDGRWYVDVAAGGVVLQFGPFHESDIDFFAGGVMAMRVKGE